MRYCLPALVLMMTALPAAAATTAIQCGDLFDARSGKLVSVRSRVRHHLSI